MNKPCTYPWKAESLRPTEAKNQLKSEPITSAAEKTTTNAVTSASITRVFNGAIHHNKAMVRTGFILGSEIRVKLSGIKTGASKPDKYLLARAPKACAEMLVNYIVTQGDEVALHCGGNKWCKVLHWAAETKDHEMLMVALQKGANIEQKDWFGETALHIAASKGDIDAVTMLLERGADVNSEDDSGSKPLHYAIVHWESKSQKLIRKAGGDDNPKVIWLLLGQGENVGFVGAGGTPLLHLAIKYKHRAVITALLLKGEDMNGQDYRGRTALHVAAMEGQKGAILCLLEHGVDGTIKDEDGFAYNEEEDPKVLAKMLKNLQDSVLGIDVKDRSGEWVDFEPDDGVMDSSSSDFNHPLPPSEDSHGILDDSTEIDEDMDSDANNYHDDEGLENLDPNILAQQLADRKAEGEEEEKEEDIWGGDGDWNESDPYEDESDADF